jgi:catechol 2,3-dioxygenase-like lactoylglutathione lyase family enzyme
MFSHIMIGSNDINKSKKFYDALFGVLGAPAATPSGPDQANAWHKAGVENGGTSIEDPPGIRQGAAGQMYLAYLRDPDGNKLCALYRVPG